MTYLPSGMQTPVGFATATNLVIKLGLNSVYPYDHINIYKMFWGLGDVPEHQVCLSSTENSLKISASSKLLQIFHQGFKCGEKGRESKRVTNGQEQI